jgi:hypothetical protein
VAGSSTIGTTGSEATAADGKVGDKLLDEIRAVGELLIHVVGKDVEDALLLGAVLVQELEARVELGLDVDAEPVGLAKQAS